jgi:hypothetical protein
MIYAGARSRIGTAPAVGTWGHALDRGSPSFAALLTRQMPQPRDAGDTRETFVEQYAPRIRRAAPIDEQAVTATQGQGAADKSECMHEALEVTSVIQRECSHQTYRQLKAAVHRSDIGVASWSNTRHSDDFLDPVGIEDADEPPW